MIEEIVQTVHRLSEGLEVKSRARILVLGDPFAEVCRALAPHFPDVTCCPDRQGPADAPHANLGIDRVDSLVCGEGEFDIVVAGPGWRRVQALRSADRLSALMRWMSEHAKTVVVEAPRTVLAPDLHDLGPYDLTALADFAFVTEVAGPDDEALEMSRPLLIASNAGALLPDQWIPAERLQQALTPGVIVAGAVQTFITDDAVLKIEISCPDYFERSAVLAEAEFLATVAPEVRARIDLPRLHQVQRGRAVSLALRDAVPGHTLAAGAFQNRPEGIVATIDAASRMASVGLFHNDLRPWNLVWDGTTIRFIDFADAGPDDRDGQHLPQVHALAATVAALMTAEVEFGEAFIGEALRLGQAAGIGTTWSADELRTDAWLGLPRCADALAGALTDALADAKAEGPRASGPVGAAEIMAVVLRYVMAACPVRAAHG